MPIYEKPVRTLMREMADAMQLQAGQTISRDQAVSWFAQNYPKIKRSTVTAHLLRLSTNAPSRVHHNAKPADDLFFQTDSDHYRLFHAATDPAPIYSSSEDLASRELQAARATPEGPDLPTEFAYESDLRDFLAKNLSLLEPGLRLYQEDGITGIEFPVGGRFIDILALDARNQLVVIELKVSKGYDRVVGQLLRYMGWIQENHAEDGQVVRGAIVARVISTDLVLACSRVSGVELFEYELSVKLKRVGS